MSRATPHPPMDERRLVDLITDEETGLLNDAYFHLRLDEEFKKSWRYGWPSSLILIEVEGLDAVESAQGRTAADSLMLDVAGEVLTASRDVDLAARMGRSRFAMFLPGTPAEGARTMVQRVMSGVLERVERRVDLNVGLTEAPQEDLATSDEFLARARRALETARERGRGQVVTWNARSD